MNLKDQIEKYWTEQVSDFRALDKPNWVTRKIQLHEKRGNEVVRITGKGNMFRQSEGNGEESNIDYNLQVTFLIRHGDYFYHEEQQSKHQALFYRGQLVEDREVADVRDEEAPTIEPFESSEMRNQARFTYDRRAAVQYAERWWDDYNPEYKTFDVDCTNYISQCVHAGGAPMRGMPNRSQGWWYSGDNWSYSWAVAHSFRWYLSGSNQGLKGKELERPEDLLLGDVICYDFEGDGRWNHTTIVVAKDTRGMPLVNAHTTNSRHRYWSYEDSYAWTEDCQYKFFRIGE
ncbi:amidase domain-containing protein [Radiobacillus deserti]|uniref:Amidase domain-containing protein n=1 Tax=Radiobacillus deserti TaxID=2594883 RepID=A0A516KE03_9BACI|nr:amidase domain-containing protein [Radiobacillus deserti]QDP39597.1 amidase domain-containing protein [Radiobacillus deserti]